MLCREVYVFVLNINTEHVTTLCRQNTGSWMLNLPGHAVTTQPWNVKQTHLLCSVAEVDFVNWRVGNDGSYSGMRYATKTDVLSISLWTYFHCTTQARLFLVDLCAVWRHVNMAVCSLEKGEATVALHYRQKDSFVLVRADLYVALVSSQCSLVYANSQHLKIWRVFQLIN
jgi:hypothetical protein